MAHRLLFPLATLFALVAVPVWLALRIDYPTLHGAAWHGHEMLFGFGMAVVAGFLCTRTTRGVAWILSGTWLAGRVAAAIGDGPAAFVIAMTFPVAVLIVAAPPLFAGAKRRENRILPALLTALVAADAAWWAGKLWFGTPAQNHVLLATIDLIGMLLLLVGGRALSAAVRGHLERQGIARQSRMPHRYELPLFALMGGAAVTDATGLDTVAAILCICAATLALVRALPWQLHRTFSSPHLWALALGYLWLVPGLAFKGIAQLVHSMAVTGMLHGIAIGALGTLTLVMMARTATLRAHKPITDFGDIGAAAILLSAAALCRLLAPVMPVAQQGLLWLAATAWSSAFLILFARLRSVQRPKPQHPAERD
jgi:uncharacterized protein involved in response to NO